MTRAVINYAARADFRQRYYANDHSRDTVVIDSQPMELTDGRSIDTDLDAIGFKFVRHESLLADFQDRRPPDDLRLERAAAFRYAASPFFCMQHTQ